jgi:hypothetical protein
MNIACATPIEDWPPPCAASRLPPAWFLTTSAVRAPAPLGECCTPAGQDSHRFEFATRTSRTLARHHPPGIPLPDPLAIHRSFRLLSEPPPSRWARCTSRPGDTTSEEAALLDRWMSAPSSRSRSCGVDAQGRAMSLSPMCVHPTKNATPSQHRCITASPTPSPFRTVASLHLRETPDRPDLEALLRVGDRTLDSRCRELPGVLSFHGLLVPLQGSSTVVARPQPLLRERAPLHPNRNQGDVGSTLDPALRWTGSVQQAAQGSRGASVRQVPLR